MFNLGETYYYAGSVCKVSFKTAEAYEKDLYGHLYLDEECILTHNSKSVTLRKGAWEPVLNTACRCIGTDPLTFECEYHCLLETEAEELRQRAVVRDSFATIGINVSDNESVLITEMFSWHFCNQDKAKDVNTFLNFLIEQLDSDYLKKYRGSYNGVSMFEHNRQILLNVIFGIRNAPIIMYITDQSIECKTKLVNNKIELYVDNIPFEQYKTSVLQITMRED